MKRIAIIGGGVNGFACGIQLAEYFKENADIVIISELFSPNTTGDGSAGLWGPYMTTDTPSDKIIKWSKGTHDYLKELWLSEDAAEAGICLVPNVSVLKEGDGSSLKDDHFWRDVVYGYDEMSPKELDKINQSHQKTFKEGARFVTFTSEPNKFLPFMMRVFEKLGGKCEKRKIVDFENFIKQSDYDIIINCSGLGSRELLNDNLTHPIRGQVMRVKANWVYEVFSDDSDDGNYIIPNTETVVLGGTHQRDDFNTQVSGEDKEFIRNGCSELIPGLVHSQVLRDWVGLRPGRNMIRLVGETIGDKLVVHNYGHGGAGVTLCWGCGTEVLDIVKSKL